MPVGGYVLCRAGCARCRLTPSSPPAALGVMPGPTALSTVPTFSLSGACPPTLSVANPLPLTATLLPGPHSIYAGFAKPRLRDIQSPLTWVSCFLAYAAVLTPDAKTRNLLTYGRLVVREAQC